MKLLDAILLKQTLKEVFEEVIEAAKEFKYMVMKARLKLEEEPLTMEGNVYGKFEDEYLKLDNRLT